MQGKKTVILLVVLLVAVVAVGLWFGLDDEGAAERDESAATKSGGEGAGGAVDLNRPPEPGSSGPGTGRVSGRVLLLAGSEPVRDVMIRLASPDAEAGEGIDRKTVTGPEGYFLFRDVPVGDSYELSLSHGEYAPVTRPGLAVIRGEVTDVGVLHLERAVAFFVEVTDGGGAPISRATVEIHPWAGAGGYYSTQSWIEYTLGATRVPTPLRTAATGKDGRVEISGLPGGHYSIVAEGEGFARGRVYRLLSPESEGTTVVVRLGIGFSLSGTVVDQKGSPVTGKILASPSATTWGRRSDALRRVGEIDEEGRYRLARLQPGAVSLSVVPEGASPVPAGSVEIPRLKTFDIRLGEVGSLVGRVTNQAGEPVSGAEVRVVVNTRGGRANSGIVAITDEQGDYRIDGAPPGYLMMMQVLAAGYAQYPGPLDPVAALNMTPRAVLRRDVTLNRGSRLTGKVLRSRDQAPIPGAKVTATGRSQRQSSAASATSGPDGTYIFGALPPGEYYLSVAADGYYQARGSGSSAPPYPGMPGQGSGARWRITIEESAPEVTKDLVLDEGGVVSGVVVTSLGAPVANAQVRAARGYSRATTMTSASGAFEVRGLAPSERMSIYAWQPGRVARSDTFALGPGQKVTDIRLVLKASARISGTVEIGGEGHPAGATVIARAKGDNRWGWGGGTPAPVGADGSFLLEDVAPGNLVVIATMPGYPAGTSDELTVGEGADVTGVRILVPRGLTLTGEVTEGAGDPVEGAGITISGGANRGGFRGNRRGAALVAQSDAGGHFAIDGLEAGNYRVTAAKEGYSSVTKNGVNPAIGDLLRLTFEKSGVITGRVVDDAGAPVSGITIGVAKGGATRGSSTNFRHRGTTSEDGTFRITGVAEGRWTVSALSAYGSTQNYTTGKVEDVSPGDDPIEIRVRPGLAITGKVTDPEGAPLTGLTVYVRNATNRAYKSVVTSADGGFQVFGLEPGAYRVTAQSRTPGVASTTLADVAAGSSGIVVRLQTALKISGRVTDQSGAPVRSVSVRAWKPGSSSPVSRSGSTRPDGTYVVSGLPPGAYDLRFSATGRFAPTTLPGITSGSTGVDVRMDPGLSISGVVYLPGGQAAAGVSLAADRSGHSTVNTSSDSGGKFSFRGLSEGKYQITVKRSPAGHVILEPYVVEAGKKDAKIVLAEGLSIRGMVVNATGQGMPRAWVGLVSSRSGGVRCDETGRFEILGLKKGEHKLRAYGEGKSTKPMAVRAGDQAVLIRIE